MPHTKRNKLIIENLPRQKLQSTGRRRFSRGETVFLVLEPNQQHPTEHVGKITDVDDVTGMPYVNRYDDSGDTFLLDDLHKLILADERELTPDANVQIKRYVHEIRAWDDAAGKLGEVHGHVVTHRHVEHHGGVPKRPPEFYVVEIVYGGRTHFQLQRTPPPE